jgi:TRAP-type C4-dicarboxylate transport system permease small subunit
MMFFITADVIGRFFGYPILGAFELSELFMVVVIALGLAYTQSQRGHIAVGIVVDRLSPRTQAVFDCLASSVGIALVSLLLWQTCLHAIASLTAGEFTAALHVPVFPAKFIIPLGALLWDCELIVSLIHSVSKLKAKPQGAV